MIKSAKKLVSMLLLFAMFSSILPTNVAVAADSSVLADGEYVVPYTVVGWATATRDNLAVPMLDERAKLEVSTDEYGNKVYAVTLKLFCHSLIGAVGILDQEYNNNSTLMNVGTAVSGWYQAEKDTDVLLSSIAFRNYPRFFSTEMDDKYDVLTSENISNVDENADSALYTFTIKDPYQKIGLGVSFKRSAAASATASSGNAYNLCLLNNAAIDLDMDNAVLLSNLQQAIENGVANWKVTSETYQADWYAKQAANSGYFYTAFDGTSVEVNAKEDGSYQIMIPVESGSSLYPVRAQEVLSKNDDDGTIFERSRHYNVTWSDNLLQDEALTFSLNNEEDLIFGKHIRFDTEETNNDDIAQAHYAATIQLTTEQAITTVTAANEEAGISVTAKSNFLPSGTTLTATEASSQNVSGGVTYAEKYAAGADYSKIYRVSFENGTASTNGTYQVDIDIRNWEGINAKNILLYLYDDTDICRYTYVSAADATTGAGFGRFYVEDGILSFQVSSGIFRASNIFNGGVIVCVGTAEALSPDDIVALDNGVYNLQANLYKNGSTPSMSNSSVVHDAVLVKQDDNATLYLDFQALQMIGGWWWLGGLWPYDRSSGVLYENAVAELDFVTASTDGLNGESNYYPDLTPNVDDLIYNAGYNPYTEWACMKQLKIDLVADTWNGEGYSMGIVSPAMASLTSTPASEISKIDLQCELHLTRPVPSDTALEDFVAPTYQPSVLRKALGAAQALKANDYTAASYQEFAAVLEAVQADYAELYAKAQANGGKLTDSADGEAILAGVAQLEEAQTKLVSMGAVDTTELSNVLNSAKLLNSSNYTASSWTALQSAIAAAEAVLADEYATQAQVDQQTKLLQAAVAALVSNRELTTGQYELPVALWKSTDDSYSMGNNSLEQTAVLTVNADSSATLELDFHTMSFSGFTGYLGYMKAIDKESIEFNRYGLPKTYSFLDTMSVTNWFEVNDSYNDPESDLFQNADAEKLAKLQGLYADLKAYNEEMGNTAGVWYPQKYEMKVDFENLESMDTDYDWPEDEKDDMWTMWVEVYAPVMGELAEAKQVARLQVDWSAYTDEIADTAALEAAIAEAKAMTQGQASDSSWDALQTALAAAQELADAVTKSQAQVDAQLALLQTAMETVGSQQSVDTSNLDSVVQAAESYLAGDVVGDYTEESVTALQAVMSLTEALEEAEGVVQEDVNATIDALKAAMNALVKTTDAGTEKLETGGNYTIPVELLNESGSLATANSVLETKSANITNVDTEAGTATVTLHFGQIEVSGTTASYLGWMQATTGSAITYQVTESYDVRDEYNTKEDGFDGDYIKTVTATIPLYTSSLPVTMYMPGMTALGSAMQEFVERDYLISLDWSKYQERTASAEALAELQETITALQQLQTDQTGLQAIDAVWEALTKVEAAGAALHNATAPAESSVARTVSNENTVDATQDVENTTAMLKAAMRLLKLEAPTINVADYDPAAGAEGGSTIYAAISHVNPQAVLHYIADGAQGIYQDSKIALTGVSKNVQVKAWAAMDYVRDSATTITNVYFNAANTTPDNPTDDEKPGTDGTTGGSTGGAGSTEKEENYYVPVTLYKSNDDVQSMGHVAFDNNPYALAVENSNGTYDIQIATNPVNVSGYTSAITSISARGYDITALDYGNVETTTKYDGTAHDVRYISLFKIAKVPYGTEFISVDFEVPYTPMDVVVEGGLGARLYFDWSGATATSDTSLSANTEPAKGATDLLSEAVDLTDDATGVRLVAEEDVLPEGTALTVDAITSGSSFDTAAKALDGIAEQFKLYDIQVKADGEDVEPSTTVKLYLPIPSDYDSSKVAVYRINSDGTKVVVKGTVEDGKYVIETKTFGLYAVALTDTVQQVVVNTTYDEAVAKVVEKYPDINNHWAASSIAFVVNRGLMGSVADGQFGPNLQLTRGMLVTILGRLEGFDASKYAGKSSFSDVSSDAWYAPSVQWAAEMGIVSGVGDGKFAPDQAITREQFAAILANYAAKKNIELKDGPSVKFADSNKISPWAASAMDAMVKAGIIRGNANGTLNPQGTATRAEVATMLQRFIVNYVDAPVTEEAETQA